jgi:hypothetical protein
MNEGDVRAQFTNAMFEATFQGDSWHSDEPIESTMDALVTALDYLRSIAGSMTALAILTARQDPELYDEWKGDG